MRKSSIASMLGLAGLAAVMASASAQAQYNAGGYSGSLANPPRQAAPAYTPPPPANRPFFYTPPGYQGGGYYDYRRYGPPNTRDSLDTCAYC